MKTLIVEDDFLTRSLLSTMLSEHGICHVAVNGKEALGCLRSAFDENEPYDLVCLDILMPVMDGQETLLKLRLMEKQYSLQPGYVTRVIMITAIDDDKNVKKAFQQGQCEAYLTKPLERKKLMNHLKDLGLVSCSA